MTSRDRDARRSTYSTRESLEVGWSRLPQLRELLSDVARTPGARVSVIQLDPDTTERVIARRDADVPSKVLYRWALALFREHAPPGAARFRVRTWTQEGRPIRGVVCGRGYDAPAPGVTTAPASPPSPPASDAERRRALARAEAAEARVGALEAQLAARRTAPVPAPDPGVAAQQHRLAEQETRIKALERERAKFKDLADQEKARADDWKDRALGLAVRVGRFAQDVGEEE